MTPPARRAATRSTSSNRNGSKTSIILSVFFCSSKFHILYDDEEEGLEDLSAPDLMWGVVNEPQPAAAAAFWARAGAGPLAARADDVGRRLQARRAGPGAGRLRRRAARAPRPPPRPAAPAAPLVLLRSMEARVDRVPHPAGALEGRALVRGPRVPRHRARRQVRGPCRCCALRTPCAARILHAACCLSCMPPPSKTSWLLLLLLLNACQLLPHAGAAAANLRLPPSRHRTVDRLAPRSFPPPQAAVRAVR